MSLTYTAASPASVFANQQIIGFYRDATWTSCLGVPIYDFGSNNPNFTAASVPLDAPVTIYDPTRPFLNGGSLQNVMRSLAAATYLYSPDRLVALLDTAIAARNTDSGAGLAVTAAALDFALSSAPAGPIVDHLAVPVLVTVTTTPPVPAPVPVLAASRPAEVVARAATPAAAIPGAAVAPPRAISVSGATGTGLQQVIGAGAKAPSPVQLAPVTVQAGLTAAIPREALDGTGIASVQIGTNFPQQNLGSGSAFEAAAGTVANLMSRAKPALAPYDLSTATAGVPFTAGLYYVLSVTGTNLTVRGSDGSSASAVLAAADAPDASHTFVGAMVYGATTSSVQLYPKLQLTLPAPAVGTQGVLQGNSYSVCLTIGEPNSQYTILDTTQTIVGANISVATPAPTDKSTPQPGDLYFGSFIGGAAQMVVWSVPVFLTVAPSQLPGASFNGTMTLDAEASGVPDYQLQITDSSLFVYSNINVDTAAIGSLSQANVFLASAVINSAPDDTTSKAFAPCRLLMGLVRQVQMGTKLKYVFVPEDDSVVIGSTRYMLSVINLCDLGFDPNSLPYPPVYWPQKQYWQFANRHNPYLDVEYTGADQQARINQAQVDTARIGLQTAKAQEPMQMYLDTNQNEMTLWPIYAFPYATSDQSVDLGQLKQITSTILGILNAAASTTGAQSASNSSNAALITVPDALQQANPYTADIATSVVPNPTINQSIVAVTPQAAISGAVVTNLNPSFLGNTSIQGIQAQQSAQLLQSQQGAAELAITKSLAPVLGVAQADIATTATQSATFGQRLYQPIYGFTVYNPGTGEAYIIEVMGSDLTPPNQLPDPTQNATYDPYYVRVVFLSTLTCYNMSIIVPSMVYDQYGHFAKEATAYENLLTQTNELDLGYLYSLYDGTNNFDSLTFGPWPPALYPAASQSNNCLYTNIPYSTAQNSSFNPISLFGNIAASLLAGSATAAARDIAVKSESVLFDPTLIVYEAPPTPPAYFMCRRQNWSADCHLMQATHPSGTSLYLAFGAGDLVPFRLDAAFQVDKQLPAHMNKLTYTFADQKYDSAKTISVANQPYFVGVTTLGGVTKYTNFSINATAGTADLLIGSIQQLQFPTECYVVGQASTTLISITDINTLANTGLTDTGGFVNMDSQGHLSRQQEFQLIPYNNLVYLIRAVSNDGALGVVGGLGVVSGLLIDTFVPTKTGNLALAQGARYKRSGLPFFGSSYTPTTMVDTLDTLDFTSITGDTFYAPTIFIPISEIDADKGFVANLSNFLGQQIWTLIYPESVARPGTTVGGVPRPNGLNLDSAGKPILSVQKLHFVYDPLAVMFTTNDLTHKYPLQPKQQILAMTNGQIQEGICWRSANVATPAQPAHEHLRAADPAPRSRHGPAEHHLFAAEPPRPDAGCRRLYGDVGTQDPLPFRRGVQHRRVGVGERPDRDKLHLRRVLGREHADRRAVRLRQQRPRDAVTLRRKGSTKGVVFINGYLGAAGYSFSSPDHFDVNDVLPSQVPLLEQIASVLGWDVALYDTDLSLPRQFWSMAYDTFTAPGLPNYIANVPPPIADPGFTNRTRSLVLSLQNPVRPQQIGLMDTYSSVVSANLHLQNGVTGSIFLSKKADRDVASIGTTPTGSIPLYGLPANSKYDFFIFSRDHYGTLKDAQFVLVDQGYAMCLVDDGSGTGTKLAKYFIDQDGNYNELYSYALYTLSGGIIESASFTLKVALGAPANLSATPDHSGDTQQRQSTGPGHSDQQGLQPGLRGLWAVQHRTAARLHPDPGRRQFPCRQPRSWDHPASTVII